MLSYFISFIVSKECVAIQNFTKQFKQFRTHLFKVRSLGPHSYLAFKAILTLIEEFYCLAFSSRLARTRSIDSVLNFGLK